jgi:uroporphyrinogen III methyltransferase/synthase
MTTPGDRDLRTDLRASPSDFFTRDLDEAVATGALDAAVHSAKDLPEPVPAGIDWCWLPWREDARDVLILRHGVSPVSLPKRPVIGVSSVRREEYARRRFPEAALRTVRGGIDERIRQLDRGEFDILIMAGAGLARLGMADRVAEWIAATELPTPPGQGALALTFRAGDSFWLRVRSLLVKAVVFAGAGSGSAETCTLGAIHALERCDVCLHDSLLDANLLERLHAHAERVDVGKRCGDHSVSQTEINMLISVAARRGHRVVRLKGGDPGIFGRLAEEVEALDALHLPYRVVPGVSSLIAATTGTGMLMTRRGVSRGFTVMTPRQQNGGVGSVRAEARTDLPMAFFMSVGVLNEIAEELTADGMPETTPAAIVLDAGSGDETVIRGSLKDIAGRLSGRDRAGIIIVGSPAATGYRPEWGALVGRRVLLPGSEALQEKAADAVRDFGGVPVPLPLIKMVPDPACIAELKRIREFDWLVVTSPSSVHMLMRLLPDADVDVRGLPKILVAGPGTAEAFKIHGLMPDVTPNRNFGAEGAVEAARLSVSPGARLLRLRSQLAGPDLAQALIRAGFRVEDSVLYTNRPLRPERIPAFDAVFFASASAVASFLALQLPQTLEGKVVMAIGRPTLAALQGHGIRVDRTPLDATVDSAIETMAAVMVQNELEKLP